GGFILVAFTDDDYKNQGRNSGEDDDSCSVEPCFGVHGVLSGLTDNHLIPGGHPGVDGSGGGFQVHRPGVGAGVAHTDQFSFVFGLSSRSHQLHVWFASGEPTESAVLGPVDTLLRSDSFQHQHGFPFWVGWGAPVFGWVAGRPGWVVLVSCSCGVWWLAGRGCWGTGPGRCAG